MNVGRFASELPVCSVAFRGFLEFSTLMGETALVTGAGRRIGRAIATRLAAEGYGLALHASARSAAEAEDFAAALRANGARAEVLVADLSDHVAATALAARAQASLGSLDLLVNNASVFEPDLPNTLDAERWQRHFAVNLQTPVFLSAEFARINASRGGAIVNIVDQRVLRLNPRYFSYTLAKSALWTATQTMAQAYAPLIRVNAVGPGPVLPNQTDGQEGFLVETATVPLEHAVAPEEIADAVIYLARARSVTGQMICVDSGQHIAWKTPDAMA